MVHAFQLLFIECNYPRAFVWWIGMHAVMFFFLFKEFYTQQYSQKQRTAQMVVSILILWLQPFVCVQPKPTKVLFFNTNILT